MLNVVCGQQSSSAASVTPQPMTKNLLVDLDAAARRDPVSHWQLSYQLLSPNGSKNVRILAGTLRSGRSRVRQQPVAGGTNGKAEPESYGCQQNWSPTNPRCRCWHREAGGAGPSEVIACRYCAGGVQQIAGLLGRRGLGQQPVKSGPVDRPILLDGRIAQLLDDVGQAGQQLGVGRTVAGHVGPAAETPILDPSRGRPRRNAAPAPHDCRRGDQKRQQRSQRCPIASSPAAARTATPMNVHTSGWTGRTFAGAICLKRQTPESGRFGDPARGQRPR